MSVWHKCMNVCTVCMHACIVYVCMFAYMHVYVYMHTVYVSIKTYARALLRISQRNDYV